MKGIESERKEDMQRHTERHGEKVKERDTYTKRDRDRDRGPSPLCSCHPLRTVSSS